MTTPPIFISHSHLDNRECRDLVDFIAGQFPGADIFFDESNLHGGDDWMQRIQREVIARPIFIVVLSRHSVVAEWVREETNLALSRAVSDKVHRKVIPVQVDPGLQLRDIDQLAPLLTTRQILNFAPGAPASARDDLLRVLRARPAARPRAWTRSRWRSWRLPAIWRTRCTRKLPRSTGSPPRRLRAGR